MWQREGNPMEGSHVGSRSVAGAWQPLSSSAENEVFFFYSGQLSGSLR